jgi:AraC-like DNA-binding protein
MPGGDMPSQRRIPQIRLSTLEILRDPFLEAGGDLDRLLVGFGVDPSSATDPEAVVPATLIYEIVEAAAAAVGDPHFGLRVGLRRSANPWDPDGSLAPTVETLADHLVHRVLVLPKFASATRYSLEIGPGSTLIRYGRDFRVPFTPVQTNAMAIGDIFRILEMFVRDRFDPASIAVRTAAPEAAKADELSRVQISAAAGPETFVSFPSAWLLSRLDGRRSPIADLVAPPFNEVLPAVTAMLDGAPSLSFEAVAHRVGLSPAALRRTLAEQDVAFRRLRDDARRRAAERALAEGASVAEAASAAGYTDRANFARAFRRWTGRSPSKPAR